MNTKIQLKKIEYALFHNPTLIPVLLRDTSINKGFAHRIMRSYLPCRIGIEFEMGRSFKRGFMEKYGNSNMIGYYNVLDIKCDDITEPVWSYVTAPNGATSASTTYIQNPSPYNESDSLIESRISIKDYHQLSGLYRFMQDLPEFCLLHEGGGIHIHVDISKYVLDKRVVLPYLAKRLDEIGSIFPLYTGKFNNKEVGWQHKRTWLNLSNLGTMEFRIAPLTFDYNTLINWVFKLIKFRQKFIHDCRLYKGTSEVLTAQITDAMNLVVQHLEALPTTGYWTVESDLVTRTS